jgi:hypothetical protein
MYSNYPREGPYNYNYPNYYNNQRGYPFYNGYPIQSNYPSPNPYSPSGGSGYYSAPPTPPNGYVNYQGYPGNRWNNPNYCPSPSSSSDNSKKFNIHINRWDDDANNDATQKINQKAREKNLWKNDVDHFYREKGDNYVRSTCTGNKKALFVGINYTGSEAELRGCINDVKNISRLVCQQFGFRNCLFLTDDQADPNLLPTYHNIIEAMKWLVPGAQPGDSLFFHYSGHGGTATDEDGDELDGFDETILPVDYKTSGQILDDEIYDNLVSPLPQGCRLTAIFDSCHSGTILDLPYTYQCDGEVEVIENDMKKELFKKAIDIVDGFISGNENTITNTILSIFDGSLFHTDKISNEEVVKKRKHDADVIQFSGCKDCQTSADAVIDSKSTGAMSYAIVTLLSQNRQYTYTELLTEIRQIMKEKNFSQIPQLSTSHPMNMNETFIM